MIRFQDIHLKFPGEPQPLLKSINFDIPKGGTFVIVGPSGHGKTVLLKLLAGLMKPSSGSIFFDGQDTVPLRGRDLARIQKRMGMLFQKNALFDSLNCLENLSFPMRELTNYSPAEIRERSVRMLESVKLPGVEKLLPDELSGGMQKRVGIARALVVDPEIILYDDPTAGLDPITSRHIVDLIIEMRDKRQSTVIAVTNDMSRAYQMGTHIGLIFNGDLILTGNPDQTKNSTHPIVHQFVNGHTEGPMTQEWTS